MYQFGKSLHLTEINILPYKCGKENSTKLIGFSYVLHDALVC